MRFLQRRSPVSALREADAPRWRSHAGPSRLRDVTYVSILNLPAKPFALIVSFARIRQDGMAIRCRFRGGKMASDVGDVVDVAAERSIDGRNGNFLAPRARAETICRAHDRARLFCDVLSALAEDLFQQGREAMALSLLDYAVDELTPMLAWHAADLASDNMRRAGRMGPANLMADEVRIRHGETMSMMTPLVTGLDRMAKARFPPEPAEFAVDIVRFVCALKSFLRWQEQLLLAAEMSVSDDERLNVQRWLRRDGRFLPFREVAPL